jgi:hypothetical protein
VAEAHDQVGPPRTPPEPLGELRAHSREFDRLIDKSSTHVECRRRKHDVRLLGRRAPEERLPQAESRTLHPFFKLRVCNATSPSKRDIEPGGHFHSKKGLPLLRSENRGNKCGKVAGKVIL